MPLEGTYFYHEETINKFEELVPIRMFNLRLWKCTVSIKELYSAHFDSNCCLINCKTRFFELMLQSTFFTFDLPLILIIPWCLGTLSNPSRLNWSYCLDDFSQLVRVKELKLCLCDCRMF